MLFAAALTLAAVAAPDVLSLEQCLEIAREQSPLMHASRARHDAALARVHAAKALPDPVLFYDSDLQPKLFHFSKQGESYLGVSQLLEFPGKRGTRGGVASREAEAMLVEADRVRLTLVFEVKRAFSGAVAARDKLAYARQNLELAREYVQNAGHKVETGDVARVELLRAQVEESKAADAERVAANELRLAKSRLAFLLARPASQPFEVAGQLGRAPVPGNLQHLTQRALEVRPEVRQIELALAREALVEKQAKLDYLPDLEIGVARHRIVGEPTTWDVTLSVPVPLFFWQPRRGPIAEARANRRVLAHEAENLRNGIRLEVEEAYTNAVSARDRIRLFEHDILRQAEEVHEMFLFSYQQGEIGGIELIEARRTLVEARVEHTDALFEFDVAVAALENAVGE